jgi:hypothetical protein
VVFDVQRGLRDPDQAIPVLDLQERFQFHGSSFTPLVGTSRIACRQPPHSDLHSWFLISGIYLSENLPGASRKTRSGYYPGIPATGKGN